jgi:glutaredoxin 3
MKIVIYSKPNCPWCVKAKELMNNLHLSYDEFIVEVDYTRDELRELIGEHLPLTVPQIFVYNKRIGGYEDFLEYCENHGIIGTTE